MTRSTCRPVAVVSFVVVFAFARPSPARTVVDHREPSTRGSAFTLNADGVLELTLTRAERQSTTCETTNLRGQADPVLHVFSAPTANGAITEIARDDDSAGGLNARVSFRAIPAGRYTVLIRASGPFGSGTADLLCDGRLVWSSVNVGGAFKRLESLRSAESLRTVTLPGGPRVHALYLFDADGKLLSRHDSGASESAYVPSGTTGLRVAMVASRWPDPAGDIRLIRNDNALSGHDPDGDGLGTELEKYIGTCSKPTDIADQWECSRSADLRDTDGDALRDDEELMGRLGSAPYQWLPRWGADPRHKDIFIEIDFGQQTVGEAPRISCKADPSNPSTFTFTPFFCPVSARRMAAIYADMATFYPADPAGHPNDPDYWNKFMRLTRAQAMNNPDLKPGVSLHLDTGQAPARGAPATDQTTYGDWGGRNLVPPVCNAAGACSRATHTAVRFAHMHANRRGLFHYALGDPGCGGQANGPLMSLHLPLCDEVGASHELGHTLGLNHYGPNGTGTPPQPDNTGEDLNCKANYPSLMNYAYSAVDRAKFIPTFSDGHGRAALNNASVMERGAVPDTTSLVGRRYLALLRDIFAHNVDVAAGHVDWNRDGVYSATPVRAYTNFHANTMGCEGTRSSRIRVSGASTLSPALTRLGGHTLLFHVEESDQKIYASSTDSSLNCPAFGQSCGTLLRRAVPHPWNAGILAVDAHPIRDGGDKLLVVYRTDAGLFEVMLSPQWVWSAPRPIATSSPVRGEPALAGSGTSVWLAFRNEPGDVILEGTERQRGLGRRPTRARQRHAPAATGPGRLARPAEGHLQGRARGPSGCVFVGVREFPDLRTQPRGAGMASNALAEHLALARVRTAGADVRAGGPGLAAAGPIARSVPQGRRQRAFSSRRHAGREHGHAARDLAVDLEPRQQQPHGARGRPPLRARRRFPSARRARPGLRQRPAALDLAAPQGGRNRDPPAARLQ